MSVPLWVKVLGELRRRRARPVTVKTLARALKAGAQDVELAMEDLRERGQVVDRDGLGPPVLDMSGPLMAEEIQECVRGRLVARRVETYREVTSTQDLARERAAQTDEGGWAFLAEHQKQGRGRFGRRWESGTGENLLVSLVLRFGHVQANPSLVTVTAAVGVCECLFEGMNLPAQIKWPNDVLLAGRKAAGVLVEQTRPRRRPAAYVVGIGLNVNGTAGVSGAISLAEFLGKRLDRTEVACEVLKRLETCYEMVEAGETSELADRWRRHSNTLGRRITVESRGKRFTGRVLDLDVDVGLTVQTDRGSILTFRPEDTTLVS